MLLFLGRSITSKQRWSQENHEGTNSILHIFKRPSIPGKLSFRDQYTPSSIVRFAFKENADIFIPTDYSYLSENL